MFQVTSVYAPDNVRLCGRCSYLIAIAVGELASKDISPRCRVWSEPSQLEKVLQSLSGDFQVKNNYFAEM